MRTNISLIPFLGLSALICLSSCNDSGTSAKEEPSLSSSLEPAASSAANPPGTSSSIVPASDAQPQSSAQAPMSETTPSSALASSSLFPSSNAQSSAQVPLSGITLSSSSELAPPSSSDYSSSSSSSSSSSPYGTLTYGSQTYKTIVIGNQTWMAENLNYIPPAGNSWCYNNLADNCTAYGRLYDWATAMGVAPAYNNANFADTINQRGICPTGWHIPRNSEWKTLVEYAGGSSIGARNLRATTGWRTVDSIVNTDNLYFSALPGGDYISPYFYDMENRAFWWTATGYNQASAYYRGMVYEKSRVYVTEMYKSSGYSVRCIKN